MKERNEELVFCLSLQIKSSTNRQATNSKSAPLRGIAHIRALENHVETSKES